MLIFPLYSDWALLLFRLALALILLAHGLPKLRNWKANADWFQSVGFRPGWLWGTVAGVMEVLGGLCLLIGLQSRFIAMLLALQFVVILIWKWYRRDKLVGGWELDLLMLVSLIMILSIGGGDYSWGVNSFMGF